MDEINVQIIYKKQEGTLSFQDALYFPYAGFEKIDPATIEKMKQDRFDRFKESSKPVEPTPEDIQAQIDNIEQTKINLDNEKAELISIKADLVAQPKVLTDKQI